MISNIDNMKRHSKYIIILILLLMPITAVISGCGIKPDTVDAPQGEDKDTFPRAYPSR